jgi:hypothetical protein
MSREVLHNHMVSTPSALENMEVPMSGIISQTCSTI